jgi:aminopeptidase N
MPGTNLTIDEARTRSALISSARYEVELDLGRARHDPAPETFRCRTLVRFPAAVAGESSFIDLVAPAVHEIVLNGVALNPERVFADGRIALPRLAAENELSVVADCAYMNTGEGLHRFIDPADGETYLYTQFEIPDARRVFACFEQPDIKGEFQFTVITPAGWAVVSNEITPPAEPGPAEGTQSHRFPATPPISTYVAGLITGPYVRQSDSYAGNRDQPLPLALYCRASLVRYLDADAIFEVTKQGLRFFEDKFSIDYPFSKYDQLFVPGFNSFGMENAGAVTMRDEDLFRSKATQREYLERADTILHEMAHMWFGNLVTMKWWNDLWLNESFATYLSVLCQAEAPGSPWTNAWTTFADSMKSKAYLADQLPSTHPIVADIRDLADVLVNLDPITYEKGASVLKQLVAYVGPDSFFAGLRDHMKRHAWGNARLTDLLAALETASGRDLRRWSSLWLERAGVNVLSPRLSLAADGTLTALDIRQEAPALPEGASGQAVLRPHRIAVGLYDFADEALVRTERIEVDVEGELTSVPLPPGRQMPAVLLINDDDLSFAKIRLDARSLATVRRHIGDFTDSLPRALCWSCLWDMTRDAELAARDYVAVVLGGIDRETDIGVVQSLQRQIKLALDLYTDPAARPDALAAYADEALSSLSAASPGSDHQLAWARAFASVARTDKQLAVLGELLAGDYRIAGLTIDVELRWQLLARLSATGTVTSSAIEAELSRDNTASGQLHAETCLAARPTADAKDAAWTSLLEPDELSSSRQEAVLAGFVQPDQRELLAPYTAKYFAVIKDIFEHRSAQISQQIITRLYPSSQVTHETLDATDAWLTAHEPEPALRRLVLEGRGELARALRAQAADRH